MRKYWLEKIVPLLLLLALVLSPVFYYWWPTESAKWDVARALEARRNGDSELGLKIMESVAKRWPNDYLVQTNRMDFLASEGKKQQCLELLNQLDEGFGRNPKWEFAKSNLYSKIGQHKKAYRLQRKVVSDRVAAAKEQAKLVGQAIQATDVTLGEWNDLAYFSALAEEEVLLNFQNFDQNLKHQWMMDFELRRCQALCLVGQKRKALEILSRRIADFQLILKKRMIKYRRRAYTWLKQREWPTPEPEKLKIHRSNMASYRRELAWLLAQRIELLEELEEDDVLVKVARQEFEDNGVPVDLAEVRSSVALLCQHLQQKAMFLDTRGFSKLRLSLWDGALVDFNDAIQVTELIDALAPYCDFANRHENVDSRDIRLASIAFSRSKAVYYNHRSMVYRRKQQSALEQRDQRIVKELGFQPGPDLY